MSYQAKIFVTDEKYLNPNSQKKLVVTGKLSAFQSTGTDVNKKIQFCFLIYLVLNFLIAPIKVYPVVCYFLW